MAGGRSSARRGFSSPPSLRSPLPSGRWSGMFSVVNTVLLRPLPFPDSDRLVVLAGTAPGSDLPERFGLAQEFYLHYKERSQLLDGIFLFGAGTSTLRTENRVERISMAFPTNGIYATLGARPQVGRLPVSDDGDRVVLISDRLWSTWFGRDSSVVGKTYFISGEMRQVIGVMPPEFSFPSEETLLWVAGEIRPAEVRPGQLGAPVVARLKPGVTREQLGVELTRLSKELPARFGGSPATRGSSSSTARSLSRCSIASSVRRPGHLSGCCLERCWSCCSSRAPTSRISSWFVPKGAAAVWRCDALSVRRARNWSGCRWLRRSSWRCWRAGWP